jgi:hypothetical protein
MKSVEAGERSGVSTPNGGLGRAAGRDAAADTLNTP